MGFSTGVTEIADSEDEPLTSSPAATSEAAPDKLCVTPGQDTQAVACHHRRLVASTANGASSGTDGLDGNQEISSPSVETTQCDHPSLQPAHTAGTNDISTCATNHPAHTSSVSPQINAAAPRTNQTTNSEYTGAAHGEANAEQHVTELLAIGHLVEPDDHKFTCTNTQIDYEVHHQDHKQQAGLAECFHTTSNHSSVEQINSPDDCPQPLPAQGQALSNHTAELESEAKESIASIKDDNEPSQDATDTRNVSSEALLDPLQRDMSLKTSVCLTNSADVTYSHFTQIEPPLPTVTADADVSIYVDLNASHTSDTLALTSLDSVPATVEPVSLYTVRAQDLVASVLPTEGDTTSHSNEHGDIASGMCLSTIADQDVTAKPRELCNKPNPCTDEILITEATETIVDFKAPVLGPIDLSAQQSAGNDPVATGEAMGTALEQASCLPAQIAEEEFQPSHTNNQDAGDESSLTSTPQAQSQSQSTAPEASEFGTSHPIPKLTPQEITLAELKAQKAALLASLGSLPAIQIIMEDSQASDINMSDDDDEPTDADITAAANKMVKEHIKLLHEYNELKDVGQGLMGLIADQRGVRIVEVQDEFGIDAND